MRFFDTFKKKPPVKEEKGKVICVPRAPEKTAKQIACGSLRQRLGEIINYAGVRFESKVFLLCFHSCTEISLV
jgi:hypothetical protein